MKRNDCDVKLVQSMVLTSCALHNLHGEAFDNEWDAPAAAESEVTVTGFRAAGQGCSRESGVLLE